MLKKSSRDVIAVLKEHKLRQVQSEKEQIRQAKDDIHDNEVLPNVKAYKLFSEGKNPVQAATKLNLPGPHVQQYYAEYWRLRHMHQLLIIYSEINDNIGYFVRLVRLANKVHPVSSSWINN